MKKLRFLGLILLALILCFVLFLVYSTLTYYNPPQKVNLAENSFPDSIRCDSTLSILTWNIGYAGLGENMDFFYDGGKKVRDTKERTQINLDSINHFLKRNSSRSFILVQELDLRSTRSYYINEMDALLAQSAFNAAFASNYVVRFVPVPPTSPMGQVNSGILNLSKYTPKSSTRYGYPGKFGWPTRLFNLRRCMLVNRYLTSNGKEFLLINSHMSAFDDGSLKKQEMQYLKDFVLAEYAKGNYVVVGGDWNQSPPNFPLTKFGENYQSEAFKLSNIEADFMPISWKWAFDSEAPSNRYLIDHYLPGKTFRCVLDFFLISPNVEVLQNKTYDLHFRNSDHNPTSMSFRLSN
jgi:endonuclease/exonuclease/phosphatase family metal-dependent hydrolase